MTFAATTQRARTRDMTDEERIRRHARSIWLLDISIGMSTAASVLGIVGIALHGLLLVAILLLVGSLLVSRHAGKVSPYGDDTC